MPITLPASSLHPFCTCRLCHTTRRLSKRHVLRTRVVHVVYKMLSNSIVRCTKKSIHYPLLLCTLHKSHTIQLAITQISTIGTSYMEQYCMHNAQCSSVGCCLSISLYIINVYSMRGLCCSVLHRIVRHCSTASRTVT